MRVMLGGWMRSRSASWPGVSGPSLVSQARTVNCGSVRPASPRSARILREARPMAMRSSPARSREEGMILTLDHYLA